MPYLSYKCIECGIVFEELVLAGAAAPACPACGAQGCSRAYEGKCSFGSIKNTQPDCALSGQCPGACAHQRAK